MAKTGLFPALLCIFSSLGLTACNRKSKPAVSQEANMKMAVIPVDGMSCVKCAARIKKALAAINGVGEAEVSFEERAARVRFDASRVPLRRLVDAINDLGYQAGSPQEASK